MTGEIARQKVPERGGKEGYLRLLRWLRIHGQEQTTAEMVLRPLERRVEHYFEFEGRETDD